MKTKTLPTIYAILAALTYALNIPMSKTLLTRGGPTMLAAFLYLGAGSGLLLYRVLGRIAGKSLPRAPMTSQELPYTIAMVVLDVAAPILLMCGIRASNSANVSLMNNFEIVATSLIALVIFREVISRRLWLAIILVTIASIILSFEGSGALSFNYGPLFVLGACLCWGFENNCTRALSHRNSTEIVVIKGIFSGLGCLMVALWVKEPMPTPGWTLLAMILGFVSYGLSICCYIMAQNELGAAKTSAYYSIAPFLGVAISILVLGEKPGPQFYAALVIVAIGTWFMIRDNIELQHTHEHEHIHTHEHRHGSTVHIHEHSHRHCHTHTHGSDSENHTHSHDLAEHDHTH